VRPTSSELLDLLRDYGGVLVLDGELIRYRGPALTDDLRDLIREHKARLLDLLRHDVDGCATCGCADIWICAPSGAFYCYEHRRQSGLCSDCGQPVPTDSTLCAECGAKRSRLVQWALQHGAKQALSEPHEAQAAPAPARACGPSRCGLCGHELSMLNVAGLCGRCVLARPSSATGEAAQENNQTRARHLRSRALVALDKRGYPKVVLTDGPVGPGLIAWAPVLREMDSDQLENLLTRLEATSA
jgi:hypothetical protein